MLSRRSRRCSGDAGITLMELVVAMGIAVIVGVMSTNFLMSALHTGDKTVKTNQDTGDARVTLDSWTSMLRVADFLDTADQKDRFEQITATKIVFYANLNNRTTANSSVGPVTKVALMFQETNATTHDGQLIEVVYPAGNNSSSTPRVRRVAQNVTKTNGGPIFQPLNKGGGTIDLTQLGCKSGSTSVAGLCANTSVVTGYGTLDPTVALSSSSVTQGPLFGNSSTVETTLGGVAGIRISFTVRDSTHSEAMDYTSTATVSSGFPS
jgi:Tfp pilus assembly protein PilW